MRYSRVRICACLRRGDRRRADGDRTGGTGGQGGGRGTGGQGDRRTGGQGHRGQGTEGQRTGVDRRDYSQKTRGVDLNNNAISKHGDAGV